MAIEKTFGRFALSSYSRSKASMHFCVKYCASCVCTASVVTSWHSIGYGSVTSGPCFVDIRVGSSSYGYSHVYLMPAAASQSEDWNVWPKPGTQPADRPLARVLLEDVERPLTIISSGSCSTWIGCWS